MESRAKQSVALLASRTPGLGPRRWLPLDGLLGPGWSKRRLQVLGWLLGVVRLPGVVWCLGVVWCGPYSRGTSGVLDWQVVAARTMSRILPRWFPVRCCTLVTAPRTVDFTPRRLYLKGPGRPATYLGGQAVLPRHPMRPSELGEAAALAPRLVAHTA